MFSVLSVCTKALSPSTAPRDTQTDTHILVRLEKLQ